MVVVVMVVLTGVRDSVFVTDCLLYIGVFLYYSYWQW